jgi:hypothetical protein
VLDVIIKDYSAEYKGVMGEREREKKFYYEGKADKAAIELISFPGFQLVRKKKGKLFSFLLWLVAFTTDFRHLM